MEQTEIDEASPAKLANHIEKTQQSTWTTAELRHIAIPLDSGDRSIARCAMFFWEHRIRSAPPAMKYYTDRWPLYKAAYLAYWGEEPPERKRVVVRRERRDLWSEIRKFLIMRGGVATVSELCEATGKTRDSLSATLTRLVAEERIERIARGKYRMFTGDDLPPLSLWDAIREVLRENKGRATFAQFRKATGKTAQQLSPTLKHHVRMGRIRRVGHGVYERLFSRGPNSGP